MTTNSTSFFTFKWIESTKTPCHLQWRSFFLHIIECYRNLLRTTFIRITFIFISIFDYSNILLSMNRFNLMCLSIQHQKTAKRNEKGENVAIYFICLIDFRLIWSLSFDPLRTEFLEDFNHLPITKSWM